MVGSEFRAQRVKQLEGVLVAIHAGSRTLAPLIDRDDGRALIELWDRRGLERGVGDHRFCGPVIS